MQILLEDGARMTPTTLIASIYSRAGYTKYAGCLIHSKFKLMNGELDLSTADTKFMALLIALQEVIPPDTNATVAYF